MLMIFDETDVVCFAESLKQKIQFSMISVCYRSSAAISIRWAEQENVPKFIETVFIESKNLGSFGPKDKKKKIK